MAPTLTATVQDTYARVQLLLTWAGITTATIERLDPDAVWRPVRNAEPAWCGGSCAAWDHEAPLDQAVSYRATSPQGSGTVLSDAFGRTVASGWGTADVGGTWIVGGTASDYSTNGSVGLVSCGSVNTSRKTITSATMADGEEWLSVSTPVTAAGAPITGGVLIRYSDASNYLRAALRFNTDGTLTCAIVKRVAGTETTLGTVTPAAAGTYTPGALYRIHAWWSGSTIKMRAWPASASEPTTWDLTVTDSAITGAGNFGTYSMLMTGNTNTLPVALSYDDVVVNSFAALTVTSAAVTVTSGGEAWLSHPGWPSYGAQVAINDLTEAYPQRRGVFQPIGAALPVVVSDVRGGAAGTVTIQTSVAADIARIRGMLADGQTLLLRLPESWSGDSWWVSIDAAGADRFTRIATDGWRRWTLPYTRVDRPTGLSAGAVGVTCADVTATYATCADLTATSKTCTDLALSVT